MLEHRKHTLGLEGSPLRIIEVGGGNGTLARDMLDWIRDNRPDVYPETTYTCLEISSKLAARQYDTIVVKGGHSGRFHLSRGNAWHLSTWGTCPVWDHTYVLMMEVLDNLPHDRVYRRSEKHPWHQTYVVALPDKAAQQGAPTERLFSPPHTSAMEVSPSRAFRSRSRQGYSMETGPWREELGPLEDPLIKRALASSYVPTTLEERLDRRLNRLLDFLLARESEPEVAEGELFFVPTAALALLDVLHRARPNHSLIATDFDRLPDVRIPGRNAPLVAEKGEVMKRYREMERTATICSFNPMIDDFRNARFFFGDSVGRTAAEAGAQLNPAGEAQAQSETQTCAAPSSSGTQQVLGGRGRQQAKESRATIVDWDGASGDRRAPWADSNQRQSKGSGVAPSAIPSNLPEWAQKKLLEQQQRQQQPHEHQRSHQAPDKSPNKGSKQ
ncbi:putative S-adenosyl-L-methionine-dependent methyltransferase-domain-containing protein [Dunaliella salina]|uniref:Protein arginine methyltransferase NDUFAF7 n=1 Tax=Dunaliella salina TaxID=3046 RepID=A0ABQ7G2N3_DUNSA|nr:putative S-adenosyl-L-methionine-dependent methyltransferase-domain-containing protein [Dunaliella salina]|eukprot:KAF5828863.1 putative S-adenosyl-L-methionine-dependent methyltransferase-domain-containing protein [Dunaliella salina]